MSAVQTTENLGSILNVLTQEAPKYGVSITIDKDELVIRVPNKWLFLDRYEAGPARLFTYHFSVFRKVFVYHTYGEFRIDLVDSRVGRRVRCVLNNVGVREGWLGNDVVFFISLRPETNVQFTVGVHD